MHYCYTCPGSVQVWAAVRSGALQSPAGQPGQTGEDQDQAGRAGRHQPADRPPGEDGAESGPAAEFPGLGWSPVPLERTASQVRTVIYDE